MRNVDDFEQAVCSRHPDPDLWMNEETEEEAIRICLTGGPGGKACPALAACVDMGTDPSQHYYTKEGVWGGMNNHRRNRIRGRRQRGDADRYHPVTLPATNCQGVMQESSL